LKVNSFRRIFVDIARQISEGHWWLSGKSLRKIYDEDDVFIRI